MPAAAPAPSLAPTSARNSASPNLAAPDATAADAGEGEPERVSAAACASTNEPKEAAAGDRIEDAAAAAAEAMALGATVESDTGTESDIAKDRPKQPRKIAGKGRNDKYIGASVTLL